MNKNIILCGFMGCGKTTIGQLLAQRCNMEFVDMDSYIEHKENMTVSKIFSIHGEEYFRDCEHNACKELSKCSNLVIATGGGALTFERNTEIFKNNGTIILLDVHINEIEKRLENDTTRPLLQKENKNSIMQQMYAARMPLYKSACDYIIESSCSPSLVVEKIIYAIKSP